MADREAMARAYYDALDDHDYERLADLLAPTFVHDRPDRTIDGRDRFVQFMREERPKKDTSHPVDAIYLRDDSESGDLAVRGRLLDARDERLVGFVDVFGFARAGIETIRTYTR